MGILVISGLIYTLEFVIRIGIINSANLMDYKSIALGIQPQKELTNTISAVPQDLQSNPIFLSPKQTCRKYHYF